MTTPTTDRLAASLPEITKLGERPTPEVRQLIDAAKTAYFERGEYATVDPVTKKTFPSAAVRAKEADTR